MIKLREGFHETKNGKTKKKTKETKSSFYEWVKKIEKPLHQIREKEAQIKRTRIKWGLSLLGIKKKKKISREYHEQPLCQQIIQLRKKGHFPKKDTNYWKWPEVEIESLHRAVESKEIELIILNFSLSLSLLHTLPHTHTHKPKT